MGFLIDCIVDAIRHRRIASANRKNRGVVMYKPSQVGGFVEVNSCFENTLISGGDSEIRAEAIEALCISAANAGQSVIVLHQGDTVCERKLSGTFSGFSNFHVVNRSNPIFDPIYGLNQNQIVDAIVKTAPKEYSITPSGGAYLRSLVATLSTKLKYMPLPSIYSLIRDNTVPQLLQSGQLPATVAYNIRNLYVSGQTEANAVNSYIYALKNQCDSVLPKTQKDYLKCCTLDRVIASKGVLVLDVISDMNHVYLRLLTELFTDLVRCGKRFLLILDGLAITEENGLKAFLTSQNYNVGIVVAGNDVYSACGCNEEFFRMLLGRSHKWFVFRHMSDESATQWSKGFGAYEKIETSVNVGRGVGTGAGLGTGYAGWNSNKQAHAGETMFLKDEARVRSFEIQQMKSRQGFVYTQVNNELAFVTEFVT